MNINHIDLKEYDYHLPPDRIARYPSDERDMSRLLVFQDGMITTDLFRNIDKHLPPGSLLVFNNTRVIRARILFRKETGAVIEVLCLEPLLPSEYESSLGCTEPVEWKCIIGNLKKWKSGIIKTSYNIHGKDHELTARKVSQEGDAWRIRFEWSSEGSSFGEIIEVTGQLPIPPYLERDAGPEDLTRYQTVYSRINGSVAAPTAGLHFTNGVIERIRHSGTATAEITLHVGAGTFKPVQSGNISDHRMHCEYFSVSRETIQLLIKYEGKTVAVGTTSVRTLESIFWLGIKLKNKPAAVSELSLSQWFPYESDSVVTVRESLEALLEYMITNDLQVLHASTSIMILPGYEFRMMRGIITNFHQPMSTLLLLVSAWIGDSWKEVYSYAIDNGFRFLSYGDCSLLFRE